MSEAFLKVVNMSISAGWLVLAVLALRLLLKKAPKWVNVLLWGIVAIRLICPFSIESALSLIPSAETISPEIMMDPTPTVITGIPALNSALNPVISDSFAPDPGDSANPLQIWIQVLSVVWAVGVAGMLAYALISYLRLKKRVSTAFPIGKNIRQSEFVDSPFVLGVIRPVIYLPFRMDSADMEPVIAHELTHIRRKDHWWKPLGYALLAVHWFNPLMWVAYILLCRDIELACDEKVIAELDNESRANYTQALVACSVNRRAIAACPLAFGEVGVKERVKSIMNYRKPTFWGMVTALVVCVVVAVCFLTDPDPSREFSMSGRNVSSLDPEAIVERILDIEDWESSNVYMNSNNFSLHVDSNFNWMDSQTVRYFFSTGQKTYSAQLRIFPEEEKYLLTEPGEWQEQDRIFLLRHYLEAVKYLPQYEIQQMAPADQYIISHIDGGSPSDYDRVITYSSQGVEEIDSWFIHLRLEPLHAVGEGYHGTGEEVVDLFYGDTNVEVDYGITMWFNFGVPEVYDEPVALERTHPAFHGVTFRCDGVQFTAEDEYGEKVLFTGMPIRNAFFTDLTGDAYPEICATVNFGSGLVDTHVVVYDYVTGQEYTLWDRENYDFCLRLEDEVLYWDQYTASYAPGVQGSRVGFGELAMVAVNGKFAIDQQYVAPVVSKWVVDIEDRSVTELLPTDEAMELFYEDEYQDYFFPSIRSHLVMVTYSDGSTEDIRMALEKGSVEILDLNRFGIQYTAKEKFSPTQLQTVIPDTGQGYLAVAKEYCGMIANGFLEATPGSRYCYSYIDFTVEAAEDQTNFARRLGNIDDNTYAFTLTVVFVPENEKALTESMAGNTTGYTGDDPDVPAGAYTYTRCGYISLTEEGWQGWITGTSW